MNLLEVVIGPYPEIRGGVDKMVALLVDGLLAKGSHVTVFVPGGWENAELEHREVGGVTVYTRRLRLPFGRGSKLRGVLGWLVELPGTLLALRGICRRHRIDLVHIHTATNYVYWFRLLRLIGGPPYVITFHRGDVVDFPSRGSADKALIRWSLAGAAATNAVSGWLAEEAKRVFPRLCDPVCIYNGIGVSDSAERSPARHSAAMPVGDAPFLVMVGTFDPYKGHDIAIRAWSLLPLQDRAHLLIIGDGELRRTYLDLIDQLGCGAWVHLTGQLPNDEVQRLMASAMAMVFPSRSEGLPYVALEAGSAGLPLICTRVPPFDEIVADGESGILVQPENPADLAAAVTRLARDPALRRRLGECLRRTVESKFSAAPMTESYLDLFAAARLGNRRSR